MRSMTLWNDPWSVLNELGNLPGPFSRATGECPERSGYTPRMDIWGDDEKVVIEMEVPGLDPKDAEISVEDAEITIAGEVKPAERDEKTSIYRRERSGGTFARTIRIPFPADPDKVTAACQNGLLRVIVPRAETSKPRKVEVKAA